MEGLSNVIRSGTAIISRANDSKWNRGQRPRCNYCQNLGHFAHRCYRKYPHLKPTNVNFAQTEVVPPSTGSVTISAAEYATLLKRGPPLPPAHDFGNHVACISQSSLGPWIIDSGATDHLCGNKDLFTSLTYSDNLPSVTLADGTKAPARGIGQAKPTPFLTLTSVYYIPGIPFNLISVSQLTHSLSCTISFSGHTFSMQDPGTGKKIGGGRESRGLYYLDVPSSPVACSLTESPELIHSRLGHPSLSKLQHMVPFLSGLGSLNCQSCQQGKHTRSSFANRVNNRANAPFSIVHSDIWGPSRTASVLGFQYFITFIDDYSRCT